MRTRYYFLNELIKSYHVFKAFDTRRANELLTQINKLRLEIAEIADLRQNYYSQIDYAANASGYVDSQYFSNDDIRFLVKRFVANLVQSSTVSLLHQGNRQSVLTRQEVQWQQLFSNVQTANNGQNIPFDLPLEIYFDKNETLEIAVRGQTELGQLIIHGCNLKDDYTPNKQQLIDEIEQRDFDGNPFLPQSQLVPIQFYFPDANLNTKALAVGGGNSINSVKSDRSVILTHVSTTSILSRMSIYDNGRNQTWCNEVESMGIAGLFTNQYTVYYPLPYPHLLRKNDRLSLDVLNGSLITNTRDTADAIQTVCFKGFTI